MYSSDGEPARLPKFLIVALLLLIGASLLLPVWCVEQPPLLDYPNHLARSFVLLHLGDPAYQFAANFRSDWKPYPYVSMDLAMLALQRLMAPEIAGKVMLSFTVLLLPVSLWFFLRQTSRGNEWLTPFAGLICYDIFFLEGFINFQLALGVALLLAGFWHKYRERLTLRGIATVFAWAMLLYLTHLIVFAGMAIALTLAAFLDDSRGIPPQGPWLSRDRLWNAMRTAALFIPGCILFVLMRPGLKQRNEFEFREFHDKIDALYEVPTHGFADWADKAMLVLLVAAILVAVVKNRELRRNGCWPWVWLALTAVYFALPLSWGQTFDIDVRILPLLFLLGLGTFHFGRRRAQMLGLVALVVLAVRVTDIVAGFRAEVPLMNSLAESVADIPAGARVLPVVEVASDQDPILRPFGHYWAYATIRRGAFSPYLFDIPGQMPLRITSAPYAPEGFWDLKYQETPDWTTVRNEYDFIWAYNVERFATAMAAIADPVYRKDSLVLYRIRKPDTQPERKRHKPGRSRASRVLLVKNPAPPVVPTPSPTVPATTAATPTTTVTTETPAPTANTAPVTTPATAVPEQPPVNPQPANAPPPAQPTSVQPANKQSSTNTQ